jgi:hypothetical protein
MSTQQRGSEETLTGLYGYELKTPIPLNPQTLKLTSGVCSDIIIISGLSSRVVKSKTKWFLSTKKNVTLPSYIRLILPRFEQSNLQISGLKIGTLSYRALSFVFTDKSELPLVLLLLQPYPKHFQIFLWVFFFFWPPHLSLHSKGCRIFICNGRRLQT